MFAAIVTALQKSYALDEYHKTFTMPKLWSSLSFQLNI